MIYLSIETQSESNDNDKVILNNWQMAGLVITGGVTLLFVASIGLYWYADTLYKKGDDFSRVTDYQSSAAYLSSALKYHKEHVYEDKLSYVLANLAFVAASQNEKETAKKLTSVAEYYNIESLKESPKNVLYWKTRAKNYYLFYSIDQKVESLDLGLEALRNAQNLSPTDPKIPYSLALFSALKYDVESDQKQKDSLKKDALQFTQQTIALKPDYRDGYILQAQLLKKFGDKEGARKALEYILQHVEKDDKEAKKMLGEL